MSTSAEKGIPSRKVVLEALRNVSPVIFLGEDYEENGRIYAPFAGEFAVAELANECRLHKIKAEVGCKSKKEGVPHIKVVGWQ